MAEYWIWNNEFGGWRAQRGGQFTTQLHRAARYSAHFAEQAVAATNKLVSPTDYPREVVVEVNNRFLTAEAQRVLAEFESTGDRAVIDNAYFRAVDHRLATDPALQESLAQAGRGEGRTLHPQEIAPDTEEEKK